MNAGDPVIEPAQAADGAEATDGKSGGDQQSGDVGGDIATAASNPTAGSDSLTAVVQSAFDLRWTMAGLANDTTADVPLGDLQRLLPTEHELSRSARAQLEVVRLENLISCIESLFPPSQKAIPSRDLEVLKADLAPPSPAWDQVATDLKALHLDILAYLVCLGRTVLLAYQLGRSLRDTVIGPAQARANELGGTERERDQDLPATSAALTAAFGRNRIAILQEWLATLEPHFPDKAASVAKASLGRWSDLVTAAFVPGTPGKVKGGTDERASLVDQAAQALLPQGDIWLGTLVGAESLDGHLTPEAYIAAGEEALSRSARIIRRVAFHYWVAILVVVLAAAALITLSAVYLGGAGKVWTQIATIGGTLGITAKGIGTRVTKLADAGEKHIYRAAEVDALAWAVTTLPQAALSFRGVHALRRAGIPGSAPLGRA